MNTYIVEVHPYPKIYTVQSFTQEEAKAIAQQKFSDDMNGASIYETNIERDFSDDK